MQLQDSDAPIAFRLPPRASSRQSPYLDLPVDEPSSEDSDFDPRNVETDGDAEPDEFEEEVLKEHSAGIAAVKDMLQVVLDHANQISDHVPLILDIELMR
jgi:hypothetical protein